MLKILSNKYSNLAPAMPKYNAICVFDLEAANIVFKYSFVDFVFAMNEITGRFKKCFSLAEVERFYMNIE